MKNRRAKVASVDMAVVDVWQRELGELSNRKFGQRLASSQDVVLRLDISKKLEKNRGWLDGASFNADGNVLVYGMADSRIRLWDWEAGISKLTFDSGHVYINNVFVVKIMPYTDDRSLITSSSDGQVRHAQISEYGVETRVLGEHHGPAYDLAVEPGSPHLFYSCGGDGVVKQIDLRTVAATDLFKCWPIDDRRLHFRVVPLYHIAVDPRNPNLFAVAGLDKYTRLYDIRKSKRDGSTDFGKPVDHFHPLHLIGVHLVGVTGLAFSYQSELLVSYSDISICLFTQNMGLGHDPVSSSSYYAYSEANITPQVYKGLANKEREKGVSFFGPKSEYVVTGSDYGRIFIWKKKGGELVRVMKGDKRSVNSIESHPQTGVLASCGTEEIKIWTPMAIDKAVLPTQIELDQQVRGHGRYRFASFPRVNDVGEYFSCGLELSSSEEE
ncbi:hypothetical protein V6N13_122094 [Hibiscus sabdariffa]